MIRIMWNKTYLKEREAHRNNLLGLMKIVEMQEKMLKQNVTLINTMMEGMRLAISKTKTGDENATSKTESN